MSIKGYLCVVDEARLQKLRESAEARQELMMAAVFGTVLSMPPTPELADAMYAILPAAGCLYRLVPRALRLRWLHGKSSEASDSPGENAPSQVEGAGPLLSLGKDWHLVHAAVAGSWDDAEGPGGSVVMGGEEIGDDLGYGPMRFMEPSDVAAVADWLAKQDGSRLVAAMDTRALSREEELYGAEWLREGGMSPLLAARVASLQQLYADAEEAGSGLALWLA